MQMIHFIRANISRITVISVVLRRRHGTCTPEGPNDCWTECRRPLWIRWSRIKMPFVRLWRLGYD